MSEGFVLNFLIAAITASFTLLDDGVMLVCKRETDIISSNSCCLATIFSDEGDLQTNENLFSLFFFSFGKKKEKKKKKRGTHLLNFRILLERDVWLPLLFLFTVPV